MAAISPIAAAPITGTPGAVVNVSWGLGATAGNAASAHGVGTPSASMAAVNDNIAASATGKGAPTTVLAVTAADTDGATGTEVSIAGALTVAPALAGSFAPVIHASAPALAASAAALTVTAAGDNARSATMGGLAAMIAVGMATATGQALVGVAAFSGTGAGIARASATLNSVVGDMSASATGNNAPVGTLSASGAMTLAALADRTVAWSLTALPLVTPTRTGTAIVAPVSLAAAPDVEGSAKQTLSGAAPLAALAIEAAASAASSEAVAVTFAARPNITALAAQFNASGAMMAAGALGGSAIGNQAPAAQLVVGAGFTPLVTTTTASAATTLAAQAGMVCIVASVRTPAGIDLTDSEILATLRSFLMEVFPWFIEIIQGQSNRVPQPLGPSYVVMTPIGRKRLATNVHTLSTFGHRGTNEAKASFQYDIQLDVYGPDAADNAQILATLMRDEYATRYFDAQPHSIQSLYPEDPRQMVFTNAEAQYENRWTIDVALQANPIVSTAIEYADTLQIDGLINVDVEYPPGG